MSTKRRVNISARVEAVRSGGQRQGSAVSVPSVGIPNHRTAKLSALDMQVVLSVPPGGNWKNVPLTVPGRRLQTIRASYAAGEGSRSTYYGRLRPDRPAYTINTYFGRPGNGCHIHYDFAGGQHRVLSQREAARLQSFPDTFEFLGPQTAISKQIGNAVPPLLAYQIARSLGEPGSFVELFAGAGGMSLGFVWAGWKSIVSTDIDSHAMRTHAANIDGQTMVGDIRSRELTDQLVRAARNARRKSSRRFLVLGGPPCQGFSTAGKPRSMDDERNHLVWHYKRLLDALRPDGFVFENVTGLLNMDAGRTFRAVSEVLSSGCDSMGAMVLAADEYGVPQRRTRVILVGSNWGYRPEAPPPITVGAKGVDLFGRRHPAITAQEALGDLPPLTQGQDGSHLTYVHEARGPYQSLMRGRLTAARYVRILSG